MENSNFEEETKNDYPTNLVILGNGFDLAHELNTGYDDFLKFTYENDQELFLFFTLFSNDTNKWNQNDIKIINNLLNELEKNVNATNLKLCNKLDELIVFIKEEKNIKYEKRTKNLFREIVLLYIKIEELRSKWLLNEHIEKIHNYFGHKIFKSEMWYKFESNLSNIDFFEYFFKRHLIIFEFNISNLMKELNKEIDINVQKQRFDLDDEKLYDSVKEFAKFAKYKILDIFKRWLAQKANSINKENKMEEFNFLDNENNVFLNFNFSKTRKILYPGKNTLEFHIHGNIDNEIILGHSYETLIDTKNKIFKNDTNDLNWIYRIKILEIWIDSLAKNKIHISKWWNYESFKILKNIKNLFIIGHSLSKIDEEYFIWIFEVCKNKIESISFSFYNEEDKKRILYFVNKNLKDIFVYKLIKYTKEEKIQWIKISPIEEINWKENIEHSLKEVEIKIDQEKLTIKSIKPYKKVITKRTIESIWKNGKKELKLLKLVDIHIIERDAFSNFNIKEIDFKESGLRFISNKSFYNNKNIETIEFPISLEEIDVDAFAENLNLESIKFKEGLRKIGDGAFHSSGICSLTLPKSLEEIGDEDFAWNWNLESIVFKEGLRKIGDGAFYSSGISSLTLPKSLEEIGNEAFAWTNLESIVFQEGLKKIGDEAFYSSGISSLTLPKSLEEIGDRAFFDNDKLETIIIPKRFKEKINFLFNVENLNEKISFIEED